MRLVLTALLALSLWAQTSSNELRLLVKDPSGAPVAASGRLESVATRHDQRFTTDAQGRHTFTGLSNGHYRLEISQPGFATESLLVNLDAPTVTREVTLAVGAASASVTVIGTTPLPGTGLTRDELPVTAQSLGQSEIAASGAINLADLMNRRLNGVFVNEVQGNPFQPDVNYRGYTASPLLGTPQGLSVYMDGVRLNQPFGDVMSWDLVPRIAISEITMMPGSNPLFGLNTLGGALAIETKDGVSAPGTALTLSGGSFGRKVAEFEHGGANRHGLDWYLAGNLFFEDGWRDSSPSNVRQLFGKTGWRNDRTRVGVSVGYANNLLNGNGLQDIQFLNRDYRSVYTRPDITGNRSPLVNVTARHNLSSRLSLFGNAYYRSIRTNTYNGDINEESLDQSLYQPGAAERTALAAAGYTGVPASGATAANTPFPYWRCIGNALLRDEPSEKCNGLINRTRTEQHNYGAAGQIGWFSRIHQLTAGAAFDRSSLDFRQSSELGYLNPDRTITGVGAFGDGITGGDADGVPYDTRVDLNGRVHTSSVYATDTLRLGRLNLTFSGRFNRTVIDNRDRILPSGPQSLTGHHVFTRFNPAAGFTFRLNRQVNFYGSYSEGNRAPTSIELGCADPNNPCKLPNAMAGDPPLKQVVTRTLEAGLRSADTESGLNWNLGWFRADNRNDILFIASPQTGFGYFKNFGQTLRQGLEGAISARLKRRLLLGANYTFMNASFESAETVLGESNSRNDEGRGLEGLIQVRPGNNIPLSPQHTVKAYATLQVFQPLSVDLGMVGVSSSYARGNENNAHQPDGTYYLGSGQSPAYAVFNAGARYNVNRFVQLFVQANNLFNRRYYSAAQLGPAGFAASGNFQSRPFPAVNGEFPLQHTTFLAPGAPRAAWAGLRVRF